MKNWMMAAPLLALAACGGEAPVAEQAEVKPAAFPAGEWEIASTVEVLRSTDNTTPATDLKQGETTTTRVCIGEEGGKPDLAALLPVDDSCSGTSVYARKGRISASYTCNRPNRGQVMPTMDGQYTADTLTAVISTGTYFSGTGDYALTQKLAGKRLGDCPATAVEPAAG